VTTDLNTLLTALYVKVDDEIGCQGGTRCTGRPPLLSDSELVCLAVAQAMLGFRSEARWLRYANKHLSGMFPYLPQRAGCNKRLRAALPLIKRNGVLFASTNAARMKPEEFLKIIAQPVASANRKILEQQYVPQPPDFPITRDQPAYLKTVWIRLS